jgi:Ca2+/H+ antiporter
VAIFQFAQADTFGETAAAVTLAALVAVVLARKWIAQREERDGATIGSVLLAVSAVVVAAIIIAALAGPHPS